MQNYLFEIAGREGSKAEQTPLLKNKDNSHESSAVKLPENQVSASNKFHMGAFFKRAVQYETIPGQKENFPSCGSG